MSTATNTIKAAIDMASYCCNAYLNDLSDADFLVRPCKGTNHITWQMGHLIASENKLINSVCPDSMPALPAGFADKYTSETAGSDDPSAFHSKDELIQAMNEQRAGTLAALETLTDEQLEAEAPEELRDYAPTVGSAFGLQALHWMMHSGQWVIVRRNLGHAPLF